MAKRTRSHPLHRGRLCKEAKLIASIADVRIRELRFEISEKERLYRLLNHVLESGQASQVEEQCPELFGPKDKRVDQVAMRLSWELEDRQAWLKRFRALRRMVVRCSRCRGDGRVQIKTRGSHGFMGIRERQCSDCCGQGYHPRTWPL